MGLRARISSTILPSLSFRRPTLAFSFSSSSSSSSSSSYAPPPSSTSTTSTTSSYSSNKYWAPPLIWPVEICWPKADSAPPDRWVIGIASNGFEFTSEKQLFDHYVQILATALGSEEEAKTRIYFGSCEYVFGFGANIDQETADKLKAQPGNFYLVKDSLYDDRSNRYISDGAATRYPLLNLNHRVGNLFRYHLLSKCNLEWANDHWIINIKYPEGEAPIEKEVIRYCIRLLAKVLGSEDAALGSIYIIWCNRPFGFAAKIDGEAVKKLRGLPDVFIVLPDYLFDVEDLHFRGTLLISFEVDSGLRYEYLILDDDYDSEEWVQSICTPENETSDKIYSLVNSYLRECSYWSDCKHWFITMEKPGGKFASTQQMVEYYVKALTAVGSEEERRRRIYRIQHETQLSICGVEVDKRTLNKISEGCKIVCENEPPGFCIEADEKTLRDVLKGMGGVVAFPDYTIDMDDKSVELAGMTQRII